MNKVLSLTLFLFLFIGHNVCLKIGINNMLIEGFILLLAAFIIITKKPFSLLKIKGLIPLFLFLLIYGLFKLITDTGEGTRAIVMILIGPPILLSAVILGIKRGIKQLSIIKRMFLIFYLLETSIAIVERLLGINIFPWSTDNIFNIQFDGITEFRSTGLHGHPLQNALIVSIYMTFILISNIKLRNKLSLWLLGFIAIACFNTRAALVGNTLLLATYFFHSIFFNKNFSTKLKKQIICISLLMLSFIPILLIKFNLGGRLFERGLNDESSEVRKAVWSIFDYFPLDSFLFGVNMKQAEIVMQQSGIFATENFWIDWIIRFGVLFVIVQTLLYTRLLQWLFVGYKPFYKWLILLCFLLIASSNNSLSISFIPLSFFLIAIVINNPYINKLKS